MEHVDHLKLRGVVTVRTYDKDDVNFEYPIQEVSNHNIICNNGLNIMLNALVWSSVNDQNANMGNPFKYTDMTPIYGAVGTGTYSGVVSTIAALNAEYARSVVTAAGSTTAYASLDPSITWLFIFPLPASNVTLTEAGVFLNATSTVNDGSPLLDWAAISPGVTQTTSQLLTLSVQITIGN